MSIDHINKNKLDNRIENLRITNQSEQNRNRDKVSRHKNAKELPELLKGVKFPKFCVYYNECYNKEKNLWREFFTIEGHPAQKGKRKATTKSGKVGIFEKLNEAKEILKILDNEIIQDKLSCHCCNIDILEEQKSIIIQEENSSFKICNKCNVMKGNMTISEFIKQVNKIIHFQKSVN